jgi:hypothetical protein
MMTERSGRGWLADSLIVDRRTILSSFAGAAVADLLAAGRASAQADPDPSLRHMPVRATPEATGGGPDALRTLLALVPRSLTDHGGAGDVAWYYADIAQQFASLNLPHDAEGPAMTDESWWSAVSSLAAVSLAFRSAMREDFVDAIGFQPWGVDQTLLAGVPPEQVTLFRRLFDEAQLAAAWEATGYARVTSASGVPVWTIGEDGRLVLDMPIQRYVQTAFNNLALIDGEILVCAPTMALLDEVITARESGEGSALADAGLAAALDTLPPTTVSAYVVEPIPVADLVDWSAMLGDDADLEDAFAEIAEAFAASDAEVGPMPRILRQVFGVTAGAVTIDEDLEDALFEAPDPEAGEGLELARLITAAPAYAAQAANVVAYRWNAMRSLSSRQPYTELMEIQSVSSEGKVAAIDFVPLISSPVLLDLVVRRDLAPFVS